MDKSVPPIGLVLGTPERLFVRCPAGFRTAGRLLAVGQTGILTLQHHNEREAAGFLLHRQNAHSPDPIQSVPDGHPVVRAATASAERTAAMLGRVHLKFRGLAIATRFASRSRTGGGIVMRDSTDMSTPVTRGEFAQFEIRLEQRLAQLATKAEIAQLATRAEIAQLATKADIAQLATKAEIAQLATKAELELWGGALLERIDRFEQRLLAELARHTRASAEGLSTQISVIDEKYADLPPRVSKLETQVLRTKRADR